MPLGSLMTGKKPRPLFVGLSGSFLGVLEGLFHKGHDLGESLGHEDAGFFEIFFMPEGAPRPLDKPFILKNEHSLNALPLRFVLMVFEVY